MKDTRTRHKNSCKLLACCIMLIVLIVSKNSKAQPIMDIRSIEDNEYTLVYQAFECHDEAGTDYDTVRNNGDFVVFCRNGWAYLKFKGVLDSLQYYFVDSSSICFGDTPFVVTIGSKGDVIMHQREEEKDGSYNDVFYLLIDRRKQRFR